MSNEKIKISATKNGADFQNTIWTLLKESSLCNDFFDCDFMDIVDIDSKNVNNLFKHRKEELLTLFSESNSKGKMRRLHPASSIRGDFFLKKENIVGDMKNYDEIPETMHFPGPNKHEFIKGIDSNLKLALFYVLDIPELLSLYDSKSTEELSVLKSKYKTQKTIKTISKEEFIDIFYFMEIGYAWKIQGLKATKLFISKMKNKSDLEVKEIDLEKSLSNNDIRVELYINSAGYSYVYFYDNDKCIYIISQRGDKEHYESNCSFINRQYLITRKVVNINDYLKQKTYNNIQIDNNTLKNNNNEMLEFNKIYQMDVLEGLRKLPDNCIDAGITSPPYNKLGLMKGKKQKGGDWDGYITYDNFDDNMPEDEYQKWQIEILNEIQRVLKPGGSFFYNHKNRRYDKTEYSPYEWVSKSNLNLYQTIIWDRKADVNNSLYFFQPVYELVYWLTKDNKKAPVFNKRDLIDQKSIWTISPKVNIPHPAPFPEELVEHCIIATTKPGDVVLDPFMGVGTTALVAKRLGRQYIGFDISNEYVNMAEENLSIDKIRKKNEL